MSKGGMKKGAAPHPSTTKVHNSGYTYATEVTKGPRVGGKGK